MRLYPDRFIIRLCCEWRRVRNRAFEVLRSLRFGGDEFQCGVGEISAGEHRLPLQALL